MARSWVRRLELTKWAASACPADELNKGGPMPTRNSGFSDDALDRLAEACGGERPLRRSTAGELFPDGSCLDLILRSKSDQLELVYVCGKKTSIDAKFKVQGVIYVPAQIDPSFLRATLLPADLKANKSTGDLFTAIRDLFTQHGFSDDVSLLATHFVFATWFPELLAIAPCLVIGGPRSEALLLLDLLGSVVRRPLHFGDLERTILTCLPYELQPTLLLRHQSSRPRAKELLAISSRRGCQLARGTNVVNAFHSKAIYCGTALTNDDLGGGAIRVQLAPIRGPLPVLSPEDQLRIAKEFQPKLLAYRAGSHLAVSRSTFDLPELSSEIRILARTLGACVVGAPEIQADLKRILESHDAEARAEHWCDVRCVAIEALLAFCHTRPDAKVYVAEITAAIEEIQKNSGETGALEARQIGEILRSLGIHSKRDRQGFSIVLTERMRRQVHDLARDFEVAPLEEGGASCSLCAELLAAPDRTKAAIAESEEAKGE